MKFTCNTKDISGAVGAASKVVNAHTTVPILSNVLLQAEDGKIAVRATDLELTLEHGFAADIGEGGSVTSREVSDSAQYPAKPVRLRP